MLNSILSLAVACLSLGVMCLALQPGVVLAVPARSEAAVQLFNEAAKRGLERNGYLIVVSVADQRLVLLQQAAEVRRYVISTSKMGTGSWENSFRTPLGWHRICEWIGAAERPGQVFVARRPTDQVLSPAEWRSEAVGDWVTTRILRLNGLEPGINQGPGIDSWERFIYLHGTNQEHLLGMPASQGCVRLSNRDVMELFDLTRNHPTYCLIREGPLADIYE